MEKCGITGQSTDDNIIPRIRFSFLIAKATDTHSKYVIIIIAFRLQQWLRESTSVLSHLVFQLESSVCGFQVLVLFLCKTMCIICDPVASRITF